MGLGPLGLVDPDDPPLSLADQAIELAETYLIVPSGINAGRPLVLTREQVEFLIVWYSLNPNGREMAYLRGMLRMAKGWAKSPIGGVIAFFELVGDCIPDGLDAHGRPVGRPHPAPYIQVAATSEDQTDNLYGQLYEMLRDSAALDDFRIDLGLTRTFRIGRPGRIEPVTSSAGAREGQPVSMVLLEETHLWKRSNGGRALAAVLRRNAGKMAGARTLDLTNAFAPGTGSVAEDFEKMVRSGRVASALLVAREAPPIEELEETDRVREALEYVYGDAADVNGGWVSIQRLLDERPPMTEPADYFRFYLNRCTAPEEELVDAAEWKALFDDTESPLVDGDVIALGFDGSESGDSTALWACRWPDWKLFELHVQEHAHDPDTGFLIPGWRVDRSAAKAAVRQANERFRVVRGYADDREWRSEIDELGAEMGDGFLRFPHHSAGRIGPACARFSTMVATGSLRHDGSEVLERHMANARRVPIGAEGSGWWRPQRRVEGQPTDAAAAAISALHALGDAVALGVTDEKSTPLPEPFVVFS